MRRTFPKFFIQIQRHFFFGMISTVFMYRCSCCGSADKQHHHRNYPYSHYYRPSIRLHCSINAARLYYFLIFFHHSTPFYMNFSFFDNYTLKSPELAIDLRPYFLRNFFAAKRKTADDHTFVDRRPFLELLTGFEPVTSSLPRTRSTN